MARRWSSAVSVNLLSLSEAEFRPDGFDRQLRAPSLTVSQPRFDGLTHIDLTHQIIPGGVVCTISFDKPSGSVLDVGGCHSMVPLQLTPMITVMNGTRWLVSTRQLGISTGLTTSNALRPPAEGLKNPRHQERVLAALWPPRSRVL